MARLNWVERALAGSFFGRIPLVRYQGAVRMLLKAVELYPTSLYGHCQLAMIYEESGKRDQAVKVLTHTVALSLRNSFEWNESRSPEKAAGP